MLERGGFALHEDESAIYLFDPVATGVYEAHQAVAPELRSKSISLAREARDILFTTTDATEVLGRTPKDIPGARMVAVKSGFRPLFDLGDIEVLSLDVLQWAARARRYRKHGEHMRADGLVSDDVPELHDQYIGIAIECARHGQLDKGVWLYNQYARVAGYLPAGVYARIPPVLDFDGTHLLITRDSVEAI
jgi:hypothetical protein